MDLLDELENLAVSAVYEEPGENRGIYDQSQGTIKMWQDRFGYTYEKAVAIIRITKTTTKPSTSIQPTILSPAQARTVYLLKLEGPISTPAQVQIAENLQNIPESHYGSSDEGHSVFCKVDGRAKVAVQNWLSTQEPIFRPLFVPLGKAYKELSSQSLYPTLGKDTTLPQFRPQDPHLLGTAPFFGQTQDQYPVWYFFYGTLASVSKLCRLLSLSEDEIPILYKASVTGGKTETWGKGRYKALVNGPETSRIEGSAYLVRSEEHEDRLRKYETDAYEVVRCLIKMDSTEVQGCMFRFVGEID